METQGKIVIMVIFTIITNGKHPYGLTGRKESAPDAMKVFFVCFICFYPKLQEHVDAEILLE